jgi:thioredoxin-related protein
MSKQMNKPVRKYIISAISALISISFCHARQLDSLLLNMMPDIPKEITEPSQRATYLVMHYWDKYDFGDTSFLMTNNLLERSFVDYVDLLSFVSGDAMDKSVCSLMKKAEERQETFLFISKLSEQYLYNPDSPVYDEEKLILFLRQELKSSALNEADKIRPQILFESVMKNRTGQTANDFTYTLTDDKTGTLHALKADYILLYFNDPECEDCLMLTRKLIVSPIINDFIKQGKLKILTVYTNDDVEAWKKHASAVLNSWIYSRDAEQLINMEGIYDIKRFPTIYLLDKDKKVLLKDTTFEMVENYFRKQ